MFARPSLCDLMSSKTHMKQEEQLSDLCVLSIFIPLALSTSRDYAWGLTLGGCVSNQEDERRSLSFFSFFFLFTWSEKRKEAAAPSRWISVGKGSKVVSLALAVACGSKRAKLIRYRLRAPVQTQLAHWTVDRCCCSAVQAAVGCAVHPNRGGRRGSQAREDFPFKYVEDTFYNPSSFCWRNYFELKWTV